MLHCLQVGIYFTYIPLGDAESTLPGYPTAEWVPMDEVIRSLSIVLTQNDIDGDANNNGVLDVVEVAVGAASGGPYSLLILDPQLQLVIPLLLQRGVQTVGKNVDYYYVEQYERWKHCWATLNGSSYSSCLVGKNRCC